MHTFIPKDVDIMVWEFAVNNSDKQDFTKINNTMVKFLEQIDWQYKTYYSRDPPLVLLAHVWNHPYRIVEDGTNKVDGTKKIDDKVFTCHDRFPARYDFVVGTVDLASYVSHRFSD
jgi:hypothetical protein